MSKEKTKYKTKNLVILQYARNICDTNVVKLEPNNLPPEVLAVNPMEGTWQAKTSGFHPQIQNLRIGKDTRRCEDSCRHGVIGIYDCTNLSHLDKMVHDAGEATRET